MRKVTAELREGIILFAGCYYDGLLKTVDTGKTWVTVFPHRDVLTIVIDFDEMYLDTKQIITNDTYL